MSEYKAILYLYEGYEFYKIENHGRDVLTSIVTHKTAADFADVLNTETAHLLATIKRQQEELAIAAELLEEERAKVAHRDELLRIQGEACERYKAEIEDARQALSNQTHGGAQYQPDVLEADSILANALPSESEAIPTANAAPKFKVGDRVRIKETGQTAIIIETNIFGLHFFDTNATGLRGGFYDSDLRCEESGDL